VGFVGIGCSYSGKWFGGYARGKTNNGNDRNYCMESRNNVLKQYASIKTVIMHNLDYRKLQIPQNSIVYCDPPYDGTTKYSNKFNHVEFWDWCRNMANIGHSMFISEYNAPEDFVCVWQKSIHSSLTNDTGSKKGIEKLFILQ
jgi:DNA adenine methylase